MKSTAFRNCALTGTALVLLASAAAVGQINGSLSGPIIGYMYSSPDRTIRPLQGIIGSATVGNPVNLGYSIGQALTLDSRHFIVSSDSNPNLLNINMETSPAGSTALSVPAGPAVAAASERGTAAAFYYPGKGAYIVTGLPKTPSSRQVSLGEGERAVTRLAVSADGSLLVYAVKDEDGESLYSLAAGASTGRVLGSAKSVSDMAITANGGVVVADRGASEVFAVWDVRGAASRQFLVGARDGVTAPVGVAVSARNDIYVANAGAVVRLDSTGRFVRSLACACAPSGLLGMKDSLFRLTDRGDQTVYLLETGAEDRISFVPPALVTP